MNHLTPFKKALKRVSLLAIVFSLLSFPAFPQSSKDTTLPYLPQISIEATNGFGPYVLGSSQENVFMAYDLPDQTTKVTFRFLDADSVQIGTAHTDEAPAITLSYWLLNLKTMNLTLSPQLNVEVTYKGDSIANYYIAYKVYPDTVNFIATAGFGPFITNDYTFSSSHWNQVPDMYNTFSVKNLPPRTDTVKFYIMSVDTTVIDSLIVSAMSDQYLDSASYPNVRMDMLPLSTRFLRTRVVCSGSPKGGLEYHNTLKIIPQKPYLLFRSEGTVLTDSLGVAVQNQVAGHVLSIDSVKYAEVTNRPGVWKNPAWSAPYRGPYSIDLFINNFSIEAWIQLDVNKLINGTGGIMPFMSVDSVWALSIQNKPSLESVRFIISTLFMPGTTIQYADTIIYWADVHYSLLGETDWHHIAFAIQGSLQPNSNTCDFYFDGNPGLSYISDLTWYFEDQYYTYWLGTQELYIGGGHPSNRNSRSNPSFITAIDEIRIWEKRLSAQEVKENFSKIILQDNALIGYWNFNNENERKGIIQDISYKNNPGTLCKGAKETPQYSRSQEIIDSIRVYSSNSYTDSVLFSFIDHYNNVLDSVMLTPVNFHSTLIYDVSALPYTASKLRIKEYFPGNEDEGFSTDYALTIRAPAPLASSLQGWNQYYPCSDTGVQYISDTGTLFNTMLVSDFPLNTKKVILGLKKDEEEYDTISYLENCVPYHHSLTLNGIDNYIETTEFHYSPFQYFSIMLWFNTTTTKGGEMIRYYYTGTDVFGPFIRMKTDGAVEFGLPTTSGVDAVLHASSKFNDGAWHCVVGTYDGHYTNRATLYVDGCIVDENNDVENVAEVYGKLFMGRTFKNIVDYRGSRDSIADYFEGSLSEVSLWRIVLDYKSINRQMFKPVKALGSSGDNFGYYKFDENTGTLVHDYSYGANATLHGSSQNWFKYNGMSKLAWNCNMLDKEPGDYTFFSNVFYDGGPDTGVYYPLGKFFIKDPVPGYTLAYRFSDGLGYFDEGTIIENKFELWTNYNRSDIQCDSNRISLKVIDVHHNIIDSRTLAYTTDTTSFSFTFDMGDLIPGTYIRLAFEYFKPYYGWRNDYELLLPVLTRPMIPPKVTGNFGPFDRAIAPETMVQENTFTITTEVYDDLKEIIARFYKLSGEEIDTLHPKYVNDTTWLYTYDMAKLSPPVTLMKVEYYLGNNKIPALIQGPFAITIHETRPKWFDFVPDEGFSDISETQDNVTFTISTTLEENNDVYNRAELTTPNNMPLIGGCRSSISTMVAKIDLTYSKPEYKLSFDGDAEVETKATDFAVKAGHTKTLNVSFNSSEDNYFRLDDDNNLLAVQNFSEGGSFSTQFGNAIQETMDGIKDLINLAGATNPESLIIKPSFSFILSGGFQYSSRLNLQIDTTTGKWGSVGELKVNAANKESEAYKKSASFNFYAGDIAAEFCITAKILTGLEEVEFCTTLRFDLGFGHSWTSIPAYKKRPLKSFEFDVYGKAVAKVLWGWYSETVWGPHMFYSKVLWGDNLQDLFPEMEKKNIENMSIPVNSSWPELAREVNPVSMFSKLPVAYPQETILMSDKGSLFTWLQRGTKQGERVLKASFFNNESGKFGNQLTIAANNNAINTPDAAMMNDSTIIFTWVQTRHTNKSILEVKSADVLREFARSQDICWAVYDMKADSVIQSGTMEDNFMAIVSGRAEGNPEIISIAENRALVIWMVADLEINNSNIWYSLLEKQGESWIATTPVIATEISGIQTDLEIESPAQNQAVMIWMNNNTEDITDNRLMTAVFNGESWTIPGEIYSKEDGFFHNYLDMDFTDGQGAAVWTTYVRDSLNNIYETVSVLPWDPIGDCWSNENPMIVFVDSSNHAQHPRIKINSDGTAIVAMKVEEMAIKTSTKAISQVDLLIGDINSPLAPWTHIPANEFICDFTKQVADLDFTFAGKDTLILLSHEYVMLPTSSPFKPKNGIIFGDPYMNLVLRSFAIDESGIVSDINEEEYFVGIENYEADLSGTQLYQNYPNPCTDQTHIRFYISESTPVKLELFDINGFKVCVLADQEMLQGTYEMTLNTSLLKPGTYISVLTAGNVIRTSKIIVGN